jgi:two-component system LytT family response regulator
MSNFKVLIVDDERLSRTRIRRLLSLDPECRVLGECANGAEALQALETSSPDILYLDIQMPEPDGIGVARAMADKTTLIVFTSAWDDYAVRAFEVHAFDYLLKPFDRSRFLESLGRAKTRILRDRAGTPDGRLCDLFESFSKTRRPPGRIAVRNNGRLVLVKPDDIDWIEAADNYARLHSGGTIHVIRQTMSELESQLDPAKFLRVHRSAMVNLDRIRELQPWFRGEYRVILCDGTELTLTKSHREKLEAQLLLGG